MVLSAVSGCERESLRDIGGFSPFGSPGCNIGRTFRAEFRWLGAREQTSTAKARKPYRNPIVLALEWRQAIHSGRYSSRADLARREGLSRARVTQILNLLRLAPQVIGMVVDLGDPLPAAIITERQLKRIINLPGRKQLKELAIILAGKQSSEELTRRY